MDYEEAERRRIEDLVEKVFKLVSLSPITKAGCNEVLRRVQERLDAVPTVKVR